MRQDRQPGIRACQQLDCYPHTCDVLLFWFISPNLISKIRSTRFQGSKSSQSLTHSSPGTWTSVLLRTNGNWPCQGLKWVPHTPPRTHSPSCQGTPFLLIWPLPSLYPHTAKQKPLHIDPENEVTITWAVASLSYYN